MFVKYHHQRITVDIDPSLLTLSDLRLTLNHITGIHTFKLIHAGAVIIDDSAPLSAYFISNSSTLVLITNINPSEHSLILAIHAELNSARNSTNNTEQLTQTLIRLDALAPQQDWTHARTERKVAVREIQALIDHLDTHVT